MRRNPPRIGYALFLERPHSRHFPAWREWIPLPSPPATPTLPAQRPPVGGRNQSDREDPLDRFDSVRPLVDAEREEWALRVDSAKESIRATLENAWNEGALGIERTRFGGDFFAFSAQPKWGGTVELFRPPEKPVPEIRIEYNPDDPDDCDPDDCE